MASFQTYQNVAFLDLQILHLSERTSLSLSLSLSVALSLCLCLCLCLSLSLRLSLSLSCSLSHTIDQAICAAYASLQPIDEPFVVTLIFLIIFDVEGL